MPEPVDIFRFSALLSRNIRHFIRKKEPDIFLAGILYFLSLTPGIHAAIVEAAKGYDDDQKDVPWEPEENLVAKPVRSCIYY